MLKYAYKQAQICKEISKKYVHALNRLIDQVSFIYMNRYKNVTLYKEQVKNQSHVSLSRNFEIRSRNYEDKSRNCEKDKSYLRKQNVVITEIL